MSTNINKVKIVSYDELQKIKNSGEIFLLCFKGSETYTRTSGIQVICNCHCRKYKNVRCYSTDWQYYLPKHYADKSSKIYNVIKFKGNQEIRYVKGGPNEELENLFISTQKEFEDQQNELQQPKGYQSYQHERSDMLGTRGSLSLSENIFFTDEKSKQQKTEHQNPITQATTSEYSGLFAPPVTSLSYPKDSLLLREYGIASSDKLKIPIFVCKQTKTSTHPTKASTPPHSYYMPFCDPLGLKSSEISPNFLLESELSQNPILFPVSPSRLQESRESKQKSPREKDTLAKSQTRQKTSSVEHPSNRSAPHSTSTCSVMQQPRSSHQRSIRNVPIGRSLSHSVTQRRQILPRYPQRPHPYIRRPVLQQYQPRSASSSRLPLLSNRVPRPNNNQNRGNNMQENPPNN